MECASLCAALDAIFAPDRWQRPVRWGSPLVTFPSRGRYWDVTHGWHLDTSGHQGGQQLPKEVTVFAYLDSVGPEGGGTLAVLGSHRVLQKLTVDAKDKVRSENGRRMLALADPWLRDLSAEEKSDSRKRRFMEEAVVVSGVPLKVVEITGEPGDVVVMHPCTLHGASLNCSERPRLVVRESVFRSRAGERPPDKDASSS
jgi:ectoine hydroxylase-related dioxygenase (phytanoyl-CoA dioxygenase family)